MSFLWSNLFSGLHSCFFIGMSFFSLGNFLQNIFWAIELEFFFLFFYFLMFGIILASQISWMICVCNYLDLIFSLNDTSISSIVSSIPELLSSITYFLLVKLVSVVSGEIPKFFYFQNSLSLFPLLLLFLFLVFYQFCFL